MTKTGAADEHNVGVLVDGRVEGKDGLVDAFARMVATCTSTRPLEEDEEAGIGGCDIDDLTNAVHRTRLEGNVLDTGLGKTLDYLSGLLRG